MTLLFTLFIIFCAAGCASHRIEIVKSMPAIEDDLCDPKIFEVNDSVPIQSIHIANASYGDSGLTVGCGKADRFMAMKKEACSIGANIIKIKIESQPNFWTSTCYRAKVAYYFLKDNKQPCVSSAKKESLELNKVEQLQDLNALRESGAINREEFEVLKKEIIRKK